MKKIALTLAILITIISCKKETTTDITIKTKGIKKSMLLEKASNFFEPISSVKHETISETEIALGKKLYNDTRLSKDGNISCNSCHKLSAYGVDNLPESPGDTHQLGGRNSPTTLYAFLHATQFWDGRAKNVEEQAGMPVLNPVEHNIPSKEFLEKRLRKVPEYQEMFKKIFPNDKEPITFSNMQKAIASFEKQLYAESKFDKFLDGNENILNSTEKEGLNTFINKGCITCHNGVALGGQILQKFGVYDDYWKHTKSKKIDDGLYNITKKEEDKYVFKSPSLRNIEKTYPYFHDGSVVSLDNAVKIMGKTQLDQDLSEKEVNDIVAFLKTLTAEVKI